MDPKNEKNSRWTEKDEERLWAQTCILIAVVCFICASAIFSQIFLYEEVLYEKTTGGSQESAAASLEPDYSTVSDSSQSAPPSSGASEIPKKININTATAEELDTLPYIGPVKAQAIVKYREEQGPFFTLEQIQEVDGIGEKIFESIKDSITI